ARINCDADTSSVDFYLDWVPINVTYGTAPITLTTGFMSPTADEPAPGGDEDGYEVSPAEAYTDGGGFAEDGSSGSSWSIACNTTIRDSHLYYGFDFGIPSGSTIQDIELRVDSWASATSWTPFVCASLSWDGGTSWTAPKQTPLLADAETTYILGTLDSWDGHPFTDGDLDAANFRVRVNNIAEHLNLDFYLDWIAVQVTYTPP
ncbi:MAG: hypothetical protein JRF63_15990, partial [Deltaproteobacteria bacterium]|nr:hypothetical protein [Deltaproteobacteria bacterium]